MRYRSDIDGLRTVAVLPVVAFHLGVPFFTGGFVGVDVFFVISGFLITSLIAPEIERNKFSILHFYERRIRRIFPALFLVVAATLPFAFAILMPTDLRQFSESVVATALFSSNFLFWHEASYFDAAAHAKPLLHTWSLAVEEQFYIFFPLLLIGVTRFAQRKTRFILCVIFVGSLIASGWYVYRNPNSAFYLPYFRAWELMAGCILALTPLPAINRRLADVAVLIGLALIFYAVFSFTPATTFPGLNALFPVVGATLIIAAGNQSVWTAEILRTRPVVHTGRLSYSLYLWHWPILVFSTYYLVRLLNGWEMLAVASASLALSEASYRWIEKPARQRTWARKKVFRVAAAAIAVLAVAGAIGHFAKGFPQRLPPDLQLPGEAVYNVGTCLVTANDEHAWSEKACTFPPLGGNPSRRVLLWGDSFAAHYFPALHALQDQLNFTLIQAGFAGGAGRCTPLLEPLANQPETHIHCLRFHRYMLAYALKMHPDLVILASRWDMVENREMIREDLRPILSALKAAHIPVLLVGEAPVYPFIAPQKIWMERRRGVEADEAQTQNTFSSTPILEGLAREEGAHLFLPQTVLCHGQSCRYDIHGHPLVWDYGHLSEEGSVVLVNAMLPEIKEILFDKKGAGTVAAPK